VYLDGILESLGIPRMLETAAALAALERVDASEGRGMAAAPGREPSEVLTWRRDLARELCHAFADDQSSRHSDASPS
jgi:hypothetical protein